MKKVFKVLALVLAFVMVACVFAACGNKDDGKGDTTKAAGTDASTAVGTTAENTGAENTTADNTPVDVSKMKIGVILVGDENEGYTFAHMEGIKTAAKNLGIADNQIIWKYSISEDANCTDAINELVDDDCNLIISNSYGHQSFMEIGAQKNPDVHFIAMTGDTAKASSLANFSNAFTNVYESRYVAGVVAGMKIKELVEANKLAAENLDANGNVKVGYVGAYPYAEVVSGYTAFFLGIKSVYDKVVMDVTYTNSWFNITAEGEAANALMAKGCVIIGQHADSTGAPAAVEAALAAGKVAYSVGYNVDMLSVAPKAALTSATNTWSVYYTEAFTQFAKEGKVDTNWAKGYADNAVAITALGDSCAAGTQSAVEEAIKAIKDGKLHVFDTSKFTVTTKDNTKYKVNAEGNYDFGAFITDPNGTVILAYASDTNGDFAADADNAVSDGYFHESTIQSAPAFSLRIDGITELTAE